MFTRRQLLAVTGAGAATAVAGCSSLTGAEDGRVYDVMAINTTYEVQEGRVDVTLASGAEESYEYRLPERKDTWSVRLPEKPESLVFEVVGRESRRYEYTDTEWKCSGRDADDIQFMVESSGVMCWADCGTVTERES